LAVDMYTSLSSWDELPVSLQIRLFVWFCSCCWWSCLEASAIVIFRARLDLHAASSIRTVMSTLSSCFSSPDRDPSWGDAKVLAGPLRSIESTSIGLTCSSGSIDSSTFCCLMLPLFADFLPKWPVAELLMPLDTVVLVEIPEEWCWRGL